MEIIIKDEDLPGLYQSANSFSVKEQKKYYSGIAWYLILLIAAAIFAFCSDGEPNPILKILATVLFLTTLSIMIWLRVSKPDDIWYNGRAVAESVKTRSWRWMMRANPYIDSDNIEIMRKHFVNDLREILKQNESIVRKLGLDASIEEPITEKMIQIRKLDLPERLNIYRKERITNQALWYKEKSKFNKKRARFWFWISLSLHAIAIFLLLINIYKADLKLPISVIALAASSVLTWLQAKKHNELSSSYSLTVHEIILVKSESINFENEDDFSEYIMNCENAFSREHTQWFARKNE
jgi:predicted RNA-binding protein with RPS1 domain